MKNYPPNFLVQKIVEIFVKTCTLSMLFRVFHSHQQKMLGSLYSFAVGVSEKANYGLKNNLSNFNPLHGINQATWYGASEVLKADETIIMFLSSSLSL